jgi:hypothetical protein
MTSPHLLEYVGILTSAVLGAGMLLCGVLLVVKTVAYATSDAVRRSGSTTHPTARRVRRPGVYGVIRQAVLEAQASEPATRTSTLESESVPVFEAAPSLGRADAATVSA